MSIPMIFSLSLIDLDVHGSGFFHAERVLAGEFQCHGISIDLGVEVVEHQGVGIVDHRLDDLLRLDDLVDVVCYRHADGGHRAEDTAKGESENQWNVELGHFFSLEWNGIFRLGFGFGPVILFATLDEGGKPFCDILRQVAGYDLP